MQQEFSADEENKNQDLLNDLQVKVGPLIEALRKDKDLSFILSATAGGAILAANTALDLSLELVRRLDAAFRALQGAQQLRIGVRARLTPSGARPLAAAAASLSARSATGPGRLPADHTRDHRVELLLTDRKRPGDSRAHGDFDGQDDVCPAWLDDPTEAPQDDAAVGIDVGIAGAINGTKDRHERVAHRLVAP